MPNGQSRTRRSRPWRAALTSGAAIAAVAGIALTVAACASPSQPGASPGADTVQRLASFASCVRGAATGNRTSTWPSRPARRARARRAWCWASWVRDGRPAEEPMPADIDVSSPRFQAAQKTCGA